MSIQQGLNFAVAQNVDTTGSRLVGNFVVTIDDGTGSPPSSLLSTAYAAVDTVRPIGSTFSVQPPIVTQANVTLTISVIPATAKPQVVGSVAAAVTSFINALPIGATLAVTKLAQIAYATNPAINNVTAVQINEVTADLTVGTSGVIKAGSVSVN